MRERRGRSTPEKPPAVGKRREPGERWIVSAADAGVRLDKFLAVEGRLGSRGRATTALERGKIFMNDGEASLKDAARKVREGDRVRLWMDRPGSAHKRCRTRGREGHAAHPV